MFLSFIIILLAKCYLNCAIWAWQNASSSKLKRWLWMLPAPSLEDAFWVCFFFLLCVRTPSCKAMSCFPRNLRREYSIQSLPCYRNKNALCYRYHVNDLLHLLFGDLVHIALADLLQDVPFEHHGRHSTMCLRVHAKKLPSQEVNKDGINHI